MKHHPYTEIWPLMSGKDFEEFKADIAANGLQLPILTYKDQVLDGRNRERACEELGLEIRYQDSGATSDAEALALVVSLNQARRHLTLIERGKAAHKLANIMKGHNQFIKKIKGLSNEGPSSRSAVSVPTAARAIGVSVSTVERIRTILNNAGESALAEVEAGKISLEGQADLVRSKLRTRPKPLNLEKRSVGRPRTDAPQRLPAPYRPLKVLSPQEVDPEFTGTPMEFTAKYGHVQVMTAEQYMTVRFSDWAAFMRTLARRAKEMPALPKIDHNWLRSPAPSDIAKLTEALEQLRPLIVEAETLLARAVTAEKLKTT